MIRKKEYIKRLDQHLVIFDGAMGTSLEAQDLSTADYGGESFKGCNDHLNLTCPDAVKKVHMDFLDAGADVIETNSFRSNRITLREFGLAEKTDEINIQAAQIARGCADAYATTEKKRFIAGSMGPSGKLLSLSSQSEVNEPITFNDITSVYCQQASALLRGGVDLLLIETAQDILEVKAAILGIHQAFSESGIQVPIQAQVTLDTNGLMLLGTDIQAVLTILEGMAIDVIGINCSTGPEHMEPALDFLSHHSQLPISCLPNAGMPINKDGKAIYPLSAHDFANQMANFIKRFGISAAGGCCGTTPAHIKALVEKAKIIDQGQPKVTPVPALASGFHATPLNQQPRPFIIGERLNTQGSRKFKRLMLENDFQSAIQIAKKQAAGGAHALDVCTALTENDQEEKRTQTLVKMIANQVDQPIVIDSTNPVVMEAGLKNAPGRCLINSINLENGSKKAEEILSLAIKHNAAVIALTIDENGMANTADQKLSIANRIFELAVNGFGLQPSALIFDPLTFTLASGSIETANAAVETLNGLQRIKKALPECFTVLGASNISFGLQKKAREILNSVFLYHAVEAGLDLAILNPNQMVPYTTIDREAKHLAENLVFNRSKNALADYIAYFENDRSGHSIVTKIERAKSATLEEKISNHILLREREGLENDLDIFIKENSKNTAHENALSLLNDILLPAMQMIGDQFGRGELILPFVLQSAEIMRAASDHLEQYLERNENTSKGSVLLATVYGDVHDIGKNLTRTIIANNGYHVIDLGKQVPADKIIDEAQKLEVDAIGLSALLVSTSQQMPLIVQRLHDQNKNIPVLIGGAAVNQSFADRINTATQYQAGVHYCKDAFDALKILDTLDHAENLLDVRHEIAQPPTNSPSNEDEVTNSMNNYTPADIPIAPFYGAKAINIPIDDLFSYLNQPALYRIGWGAGKASGDKWDRYQREFAIRLANMRKELKEQPWIHPQAAYGYWKCQRDGNNLVVYPDGIGNQDNQLVLQFPRQQFSPNLCLADYFAPSGSNIEDVVIFQLVTLGMDTVKHVQQLDKGGDLVEAFYAHGLATQLTEAAAQFTHDHIRKELGMDKKRGKRYSWGYAPLPDLSQHKQIVSLLSADESMKIKLTSAYQFIPEYSTAALIVHHPQAVYFQIEKS